MGKPLGILAGEFDDGPSTFRHRRVSLASLVDPIPSQAGAHLTAPPALPPRPCLETGLFRPNDGKAEETGATMFDVACCLSGCSVILCENILYPREAACRILEIEFGREPCAPYRRALSDLPPSGSFRAHRQRSEAICRGHENRNPRAQVFNARGESTLGLALCGTQNSCECSLPGVELVKFSGFHEHSYHCTTR
jgi:hypothetical protein